MTLAAALTSQILQDRFSTNSAFLQAKAAKMHLTSSVAAAGLESAGKFRTSEMEKIGS